MPDAPLTSERGPWSGGYTSSVPAFMARPDQITSDSQNVIIDPFTGGISRRAGCSIVNDTVVGGGIAGGGREVSGLLTGVWGAGAKCRKLFALSSSTLANDYPTLAALYGQDTNAGFPTSDSGFQGTIWVNDNGTSWQLMNEFAAGGNYSSAPTSDPYAADTTLRVVPIWMESGDGVYNRGALTGTLGTDKFMQQFMTCGSRSLIQSQNWVYAPNLRCTPWRWNKAVNVSGTQVCRIFPTGPFPPLFPPTVTTPASPDADATAWSDGDTFYISVIFQFEDGSYSAPFIPRAPQSSVLTSGRGLVTVGTIGTTNKFRYLTYSKIPIGPEGTVARIILRTPKQTRTASTDNITVSPLDLRIVGVLRNNTQDVYVDYAGNDNSLVEDDDVVRLDLMCPRRARYISTGDQRAILGYTLPNTAAIMLAPVGITTDYDRNFADTNDNCYGSTGSYVRITSTDLELHYNAGNAAATYVTAPTYTSAGTENALKIPFSVYTTLEAVVDAINKSTSASVCNQWAAQLAPGIDPTMPSSSLTLTTMTIACGTTDTLTNVTSAALFGPVGVGMKVAGAGITAGTYVVSKTGSTNSSLTLSAQATATANPVNLTFYQNTGDTEAITIAAAASYGYMRAFSSTFPLLLHMKPSAFPDYATPDKTSVYFTVSSPGAATAGVSLAPNTWVVGNRRMPHASPRSVMPRSCTGIVDIEGAAIIAYSDGIYMFANQRGANTGEDEDYRLFTVNDTRGCISYLGLTAGNGWAAYPTAEGVVATDKNRREFVISGDIYNPSNGVGDLGYEITQCAASVSSDSDDQHFSMGVHGSQLVVGVRRDGATPAVFRYDFSPGVESSGVEELISPDGRRPYIWHPKCLYNTKSATGSHSTDLIKIGAIGSVRIDSRYDYIAFDSNWGTYDGRIDLVNYGLADNGYVGFTSDVVVAPFVASPFMALSPQRIELTHRALAATLGSSIVAFANNQTPTFQTSAPLVRTANRDTNKIQFQKQLIPIDNQQRVKTELFWIMWRTDATSVTAVTDQVWRIVLQYDEVEG